MMRLKIIEDGSFNFHRDIESQEAYLRIEYSIDGDVMYYKMTSVKILQSCRINMNMMLSGIGLLNSPPL